MSVVGGWRGAAARGVVMAVVCAAYGCAPRAASSPAPSTPSLPSETLPPPAYQPSPSVGPTDLSLCTNPPAPPGVGSAVDLRELAARLHGSWELNTRTVEGLTIPTNSFLYFDIEKSDADRASGIAMMLDAGNLSVLDTMALTHECIKDACLGALWSVAIERAPDGHHVDIVMDGEYLGSYGDFASGMRAVEKTTFLKEDDAYLAGGLVTPNGVHGQDTWDRISLMGGVLTYLSCKGGYIERYVKRSAGRPLVDNLPLWDAWMQKKRNGELSDPIRAKQRNHL
jgi:hypothetical protein